MKNLLLTAVLIWTWTTPDGTVWFTDDEDMVPPRYQAEATQRELESLATYPKFTPIPPTEETDEDGTQN